MLISSSIFLSPFPQSDSFWELPEEDKAIDQVQEKQIHLGTLYYSQHQAEFLLTESNLYWVNVHKKVEKFCRVKWLFVFPFAEENFFGFTLLYGNTSQDFYTPDAEQLEIWIDALSKVCILTNISEDLQEVRELSRGVFSRTNLMRSISGQNFAVKSFAKSGNSGNFERLKNQIEIMRQINHPNFVKLHSVYESRNYVHLVQDYLEGQDLFQKLVNEGPLSEKEAAKTMKQVLECIVYLNSLNIAHRDIKLENVFLLSQNVYQIKLLNLGLACKNINEGQTEKCGSPGYISPEILKGEPYYSKVDVFSAGILLYTLLSGEMPFEVDNIQEALLKNQEAQLNFGSWASNFESAIDLVTKMTLKDPGERISAQEALEHPWIQELNSLNDSSL